MNYRALTLKVAALAMLGVGLSFTGFTGTTVEARTNNNWTSTSRSQQCSREAQRYADRNAQRRTAAGAIGGAAVGGLVGGNRRNMGTGALIGGGAGLVSSNSRWQTFYNRRYMECINR